MSDRELIEIFPCQRIFLKNRGHIFGDLQRVVFRPQQMANGRQAGFGHFAVADQLENALPVDFRQIAFRPSRGVALHGTGVVEFFSNSINPAEAQGFFHRIIVRYAQVPTFDVMGLQPDFSGSRVVVLKP